MRTGTVPSFLAVALTIVALPMLAPGEAAGAPLYEGPFLVADPETWKGATLLGELNGDSRPDLILGLRNMRGNGDGTFTWVQNIPYGGAGPIATALGDLNGDTRPDIVTVDPSNVIITLNDGAGNFSAQLTLGGGGHTADLKDLNGDGKRDLIVLSGNGGSSMLTTRLGNGDGTFSAFTNSFAAADAPWGLELTDMNGDGRLDAVVASTGGTLSVFLGNGNGTFQPRVDYATEPGTAFVTTGYVNQDAYLDVVTISYSVAHIYLGSGGGALVNATPATVAVSSYATSAVLRDFDLDGKADLAVACGGGGDTQLKRLGFLPGHGDGTFGTITYFDLQSSGGQIAAADVDGDGKLDVIESSAVLLGHGDGTFGSKRRVGTGAQPNGLALADLNHDGRRDAVSANFGSASVSVFLGDGSGSFGAKVDYATGANPARVAIADLNGDTHPDIVSANTGGASVSVLLGAGDGTFAAKQDYAVGSGPSAVAIGDLNGDAKLDLVVSNSGSSKSISVLRGIGNGTFLPKQDYGANARYPHSVVLGDMNADGKLDIVSPTAGTTAFSAKLIILLGNGDATFQAALEFDPGVGAAFGRMEAKLATLNADGHLDVAITSGLGVAVLAGLGNGQVQAPVIIHGSSAGYDLDVADFDADGKLDIAALDQNSVTLLFGNGAGAFPRKQGIGCGQKPFAVASGILDGTHLDLVTANSMGDELSILRNTPVVVGVPRPPDTGGGAFIRAYPNPARPGVLLRIEFAGSGIAGLRIYDIRGKLVRTLPGRSSRPGAHQAEWDLKDAGGSRVPAGIYLCVVGGGAEPAAQRMVVLQ